MTRFIPLFIAIFGFTAALKGQTYYVKYDASCLNRYEFITDIDKTPYVVYTTNEISGKITQLDVGKEPVQWVKNLPNKLTSCSAISFDKAMTLAINNSSVKLYIIRESPTHYNVSPVAKSTYIASESHALEITMADADFVLDWDKMISSRNLATPASTKEVYLDGTIKYQCLTGYIFRKKDSFQSEAYKEYSIIPGMGIVYKRALPYEGAVTNALRLDRIGDDLNMTEYIAEKCRKIQSSGLASKEYAMYSEQDPNQRYRNDSSAGFNTKGVEVPTTYDNNLDGSMSGNGNTCRSERRKRYIASQGDMEFLLLN